MRKRLYPLLILTLALLLCACAGTAPEHTSAPPREESHAETDFEDETTLTETEPTETQPPETTQPLHTELYLPEYTTQEIVEYFREVVLAMEYADGAGDVSLVQKWMEPILYQIHGDPTEEDLAVLSALFEQLNEIPGFPGIYSSEEVYQTNLNMYFLDEEGFNEDFSQVIQGEAADGAVEFWYDTETNEIHTARIGYRTDIDQSVRNAVLVEEIINMLGISDTTERMDSVVYQYSNDNTQLSQVDWIILKLLYDPAIQCGMDNDSCTEIIQQRYR